MKLEFKQNEEKISNVFGMDDAVFDDVTDAMIKWIVSTNHESYTHALETFLASPEFKALNYPLESANSYFMIGYIFHQSLEVFETKIKALMTSMMPAELIKELTKQKKLSEKKDIPDDEKN